MKLESQVTSLELSKRLRELGVKQESLFYWQQHYVEMKGDVMASSFKLTQVKTESKKGMRCFSAFTVAELGEMLPQGVTYKVHKDENYSSISEANYGFFPDTKEADARAKMLIYLLENKLIQL